MKTSLENEVLDRIESIGRAKEKLLDLSQMEIFDNLSKHNEYWDSNYEEEDEKLHDIRCTLGLISDRVADILSILYSRSDDDNI